MTIAHIANGETIASVTTKLNAALDVVNDTVVGPDSSTDNAVAIYDSTGGHTLLNSALVVNDTTGATALTSAAAATPLVGDDIAVDEAYAPCVLDYVCYRAYSKDAEYAANAQLAQAYYTTFMNRLQANIQASAAIAPTSDGKVTL